MGFTDVPEEWKHELAEIAVLTLADFRRHVGGDEFAMLAVECRPSDGWIALSMLLTSEAMLDPSIADPAGTRSWKHEGIERRYGMWRLAAGVERMMQEPYHCAAEVDQPALAAAFRQACFDAIRSVRVEAELARFARTAGFAVRLVPA